MPDWRRIVDENLSVVDLSPRDRAEVEAELASHLEEMFDQYRANGLSETEAARRAQSEIPDWRAFTRRIQKAKGPEGLMNHRTVSIWIPGLITVTLGTVVLAGVQRAGLQPHIIWLRSGLAFMLYVPWLISLPFIGAFGAYASRRAGGGARDRITSSLFPVFAIICSLCVAATYAVFIDHVAPHSMALGIAVFVLNWIILPSVVLLVGVLPFLRGPKLERVS